MSEQKEDKIPEKLLVIQTKKSQILMNKPVCLRLSVIECSKILMY